MDPIIMKLDSRTTPKRPLTAYNIFFQEERRRVQASTLAATGRRATYKEIARKVAGNWKKLDATDKAPYQALAAKEKRRFALELVDYHLSGTNKGSETRFPHVAPKAGAHIRAPSQSLSYVPLGNQATIVGDMQSAMHSPSLHTVLPGLALQREPSVPPYPGLQKVDFSTLSHHDLKKYFCDETVDPAHMCSSLVPLSATQNFQYIFDEDDASFLRDLYLFD